MIHLRPPGQEIFESYEQMSTLPDSIRQDYQLRVGIETALQASEEQVTAITKELAERGLRALHAVQLQKPIVLPSQSEDGLGTHNHRLRNFAYDAFSALQDHFDGTSWADWYVLPYYSKGDDTNQILNLGVFAGSNLTATSEVDIS